MLTQKQPQKTSSPPQSQPQAQAQSQSLQSPKPQQVPSVEVIASASGDMVPPGFVVPMQSVDAPTPPGLPPPGSMQSVDAPTPPGLPPPGSMQSVDAPTPPGLPPPGLPPPDIANSRYDATDFAISSDAGADAGGSSSSSSGSGSGSEGSSGKIFSRKSTPNESRNDKVYDKLSMLLCYVDAGKQSSDSTRESYNSCATSDPTTSPNPNNTGQVSGVKEHFGDQPRVPINIQVNK